MDLLERIEAGIRANDLIPPRAEVLCLESGPPETRQSTSPRGAIRSFARMPASIRSSTSMAEVLHVVAHAYQVGCASHASSSSVAATSSGAENGYGVACAASGTRTAGARPARASSA